MISIFIAIFFLDKLFFIVFEILISPFSSKFSEWPRSFEILYNGYCSRTIIWIKIFAKTVISTFDITNLRKSRYQFISTKIIYQLTMNQNSTKKNEKYHRQLNQDIKTAISTEPQQSIRENREIPIAEPKY